jgi:hypothetical protein
MKRNDLASPHHYLLHIVNLHPEIDDFRMGHSGISGQRSARDVAIMRFLLKAETSMLIALIRKQVFPDEHWLID